METKKYKLDGLAIAGAIINIVYTTIVISSFSFFIIATGFIPFILVLIIGFYTLSLIFTILFLKGSGFKVTAGIFALFSTILGGIFILVGKQIQVNAAPATVNKTEPNNTAEKMIKYNNWVESLIKTGKYQEAIVIAKEGLLFKEDDLKLNRNIASAYAKMYEYELSLKYLQKVLEADPDDAFARIHIPKLKVSLNNAKKKNSEKEIFEEKQDQE